MIAFVFPARKINIILIRDSEIPQIIAEFDTFVSYVRRHGNPSTDEILTALSSSVALDPRRTWLEDYPNVTLM